jgi:hypothetical protein
MEATPKSAAIAGAWAVLGLVPFEAWIEHHSFLSVAVHNVLWLAAIAVFFAVPSYFMVLGAGQEPFRRDWFADPEQRARYAVVTRRMLVWFFSAAVVGTIWSSIVTRIAG